VVVVIALVGVGWLFLRRLIPSHVEYRGERIELSRLYLDYDVYKNDPENIAAAETERVIRLVSTTPIAREFESFEEVVHAVFELKFPGYGLMSFGETDQGGFTLVGFGVEVPRAGQNRILVFVGKDGRYTLEDDFVAATELFIEGVKTEAMEFVFYDGRGKEVLRRASRVP